MKLSKYFGDFGMDLCSESFRPLRDFGYFDYSWGSYKKTEDGYVLEMDFPGVPKENISVEMDGDVLVIRVEGKVKKVRRYEVLYDVEAVEAFYKDGRLKIILEPKERKEVKKIEVK